MVNFESNLDRVKRGREQCLLFEENYLMLNRDIYIYYLGWYAFTFYRTSVRFENSEEGEASLVSLNGGVLWRGRREKRAN